jgi:hypothetical protein
VSEIEIAAPGKDDELLAVHEALDQLAAHDPQKPNWSSYATSPALRSLNRPKCWESPCPQPNGIGLMLVHGFTERLHNPAY